MNWTIYTLGDVALYQNILNAVAAVFNSGVFTSDTGGIGGAGMLPAFLIGLMLVLAGAVKAQVSGSNQNSIAVFMLLIVFWMVGIGTKERVQIEDIYTGSVRAVDNIPLVVAVPASVVSTFSYRIGSLMQQAFSTVDATYVEMTTAGFVTPLRLLLSFRNMAATAPYAVGSLTTFIRDCGLGKTNYASLLNAPNAIEFLTDSANFRNGLTTYYSSAHPEGLAVPCVTAAGFLRDEFAQSTQSGTGKLVSKLMNKNMPERAPGSSSLAEQWSADDYASGPHLAVQAAFSSTQDAQSAMTNLMAGAYASRAFECGTEAFDQSTYAQCLHLSLEQNELYAIDATASASFFSRLMVPAMTLLSALFFALAPLVVFICLMANMQGLQLLVKYLLFGAWTQSFLPVAHVINYFVQAQFQDGFRRLADAGAQGITLGNVNEVYAMAATRIAFASDLMAATPLLTLMLFTGSYYALTNLAGRLGGKDFVEERQVVAPIAKQDPIASVTGLAAGGAGAAASAPGSSSAGYSLSQAAQHTQAKLVGSLKEMGAQFSDKVGSALAATMGTTSSLDTFRRVDDTIQYGQGEAKSAHSQIVGSMTRGQSLSTSEKQALSGAVKAAASMGLSVPMAKAAIEGMLQKSTQLSKDQIESIGKQFQESTGTGKTWESFSRSSHSDVQGKNLSNMITKGLQQTKQEGLEKLRSESERISEQISINDSLINSGQVSRNLSDVQAVKQIQSHGLGQDVFAALDRNGLQITKDAIRGSSHFTNPEEHRLGAALLTLHSSSRGYGDAMGILAKVAGIAGPAPAHMESTFTRGETAERVEQAVAGTGITPEQKARLENLQNNNGGHPGIQPTPLTADGGFGTPRTRPQSGASGKSPIAPNTPATEGAALRTRAPLPDLPGGAPTGEGIRADAEKSLTSEQRASYESAAAAMQENHKDGLPKFMGEALGDVTGHAWEVMKENPGAGIAWVAGVVGGGAYKLNEKIIKDMVRNGQKPGAFPLGDKIASGARSAASGLREVSSKVFASAEEAASVAQKMAGGLAQGNAVEGRGFMVARAGLLGAAEAAGNVATVGYMVYEFNQKAMAMADKDAAAAGFESRDVYLNSQTNPATSSFTPRGLGGRVKAPGGGSDLGDHLPPAPGATTPKK